MLFLCHVVPSFVTCCGIINKQELLQLKRFSWVKDFENRKWMMLVLCYKR